MPGLWFTAAELNALPATHRLLTDAQPGLLDSSLAPLAKRIESSLSSEHLGSSEAARRIRILPMAERIPLGAHFQTVAGAVLQRSRLHIHYYNRSRYELRVPYSDPRELVMDILKYGADVEVVARAELRREAVQRLLTAVSAYQAKETDP